MVNKNLQHLRKHKGLSQQALADALGVSRSGLSGWEQGYTEPGIDSLLDISRYFNITLDQLVDCDLTKEDLSIISGDDYRILAISVDKENRQNIEYVDQAAEAGYLESYSDPTYIAELPKIQFPQMDQGTYRAFEIQGESMLPMEPGSIVIGTYVERLEEIKNGRTYVIATKDPALVYKRIENQPAENRLIAISDNPDFPPYIIPYSNIREIWRHYAHVGFNDAKRHYNEVIGDRLDQILGGIEDIRTKLN